MLVDVFSKGINGKQAEQALDRAGITVNKNAIPFDQNPPLTPSGIRIGTPALTTRGMKEGEMEAIGDWITDVLDNINDESVQKRVRREVEVLDDGPAPRRADRLGVAVEIEQRVERADRRRIGLVKPPGHAGVEIAACEVVLVAVAVQHGIDGRRAGAARDEAERWIDRD